MHMDLFSSTNEELAIWKIVDTILELMLFNFQSNVKCYYCQIQKYDFAFLILQFDSEV